MPKGVRLVTKHLVIHYNSCMVELLMESYCHLEMLSFDARDLTNDHVMEMQGRLKLMYVRGMFNTQHSRMCENYLFRNNVIACNCIFSKSSPSSSTSNCIQANHLLNMSLPTDLVASISGSREYSYK